MKTGKKVEEMNEAVGKTLSITYYTVWELHSYKKGTLYYETVKANSFKSLVEKAYKILKEEEETI